jgi:hypothetical protein
MQQFSIAMRIKETCVRKTKKFSQAGIIFALLVGVGAPAQTAAAASDVQQQTVPEEGKFYCNVHALNPAERAHQQQLTAKFIAVRDEIVELPRGYEFQFSPSSVSLVELVDWVAAEENCCPFFNFHIDLEKRGKLLCLGLTGEEGIKAFIRAEFHVPVK